MLLAARSTPDLDSETHLSRHRRDGVSTQYYIYVPVPRRTAPGERDSAACVRILKSHNFMSLNHVLLQVFSRVSCGRRPAAAPRRAGGGSPSREPPPRPSPRAVSSPLSLSSDTHAPAPPPRAGCGPSAAQGPGQGPAPAATRLRTARRARDSPALSPDQPPHPSTPRTRPLTPIASSDGPLTSQGHLLIVSSCGAPPVLSPPAYLMHGHATCHQGS